MSSLTKKVVLHLTSLHDGGGGKITTDIHQYLLRLGYSSYVVFRGKRCLFPDGEIKSIPQTQRHWWNKLRRFVFRWIAKHSRIDQNYSMFNLCERFTCYSAKDILSVLPQKPDTIFVHWVSDFANAKLIHDLWETTGAKIVFLLIDYALFSGGCHYQLDCQKYINGCHNCPATNSWIIKKGIERNYAFKLRFLPKDIVINANSVEKERLKITELYKNALFFSSIFPLDESVYCAVKDKAALREKWGLPNDIKIILVGSTYVNEKRKGLSLFVKALGKINYKDFIVAIAGNQRTPIQIERARILGYLTEEELIEAYQFSDVFVCPSIADAGPLMVKQACLCGTPIVAFPVGVSVDLVRTGETGYLAAYKNVDDLARGIDSVLSLSEEKWKVMSDNCREKGLKLCSFQASRFKLEQVI